MATLPPQAGPAPRVALVVRDAPRATVLREALEGLGLEVLTVSDGPGLEAALTAASVELVVCDTRHLFQRRQDGGSARVTPPPPSTPMREVMDTVARVAGSDATVLVTGESGVGKELVARALHDAGPRRAEPFVAVNVAALPDALLESELFGHVRGAFTDARAQRTGLFLQAGRGTLFLDEVAELPLPLQPKLLRALQERTVRPIGGDRELPVHARVVAATNQDLFAAVESGTFRRDLYFRLAVIEIEVPPLRARVAEIESLVAELLSRIAARAGVPAPEVDPLTMRALIAYPWPGNVRELANCLERAVAMARGDRLTLDDLPGRVRGLATPSASGAPAGADLLAPLADVERRHVLRVLDAVDGRRAEAARVLGLDRKTLYRKLARWSIDPASK